MYNHHFDGWMFKAMKNYNREKAAVYTRQTKLFHPLTVSVGQILVAVGTKLVGVNEAPSPIPYPRTRPAG